MANNSIPNETKVQWYDRNNPPRRSGHYVTTGIVKAQSRQGEEIVIVEWDAENFPISRENVDDLIEIR